MPDGGSIFRDTTAPRDRGGQSQVGYLPLPSTRQSRKGFGERASVFIAAAIILVLLSLLIYYSLLAVSYSSLSFAAALHLNRTISVHHYRSLSEFQIEGSESLLLLFNTRRELYFFSSSQGYYCLGIALSPLLLPQVSFFELDLTNLHLDYLCANCKCPN